QPIAGSDGAFFSFWSTDNQTIGFAADRKLRRGAVDGGAPTTICDIEDDFDGATWGSDDTIVFSSGRVLSRVSAQGGPVPALTTLDRAQGETSNVFPSFLPDGRHLIYGVNSALPEQAGTYV